MSEFRECATCAAKPGAPQLCPSCLINREVSFERDAALARVHGLITENVKFGLQRDAALERVKQLTTLINQAMESAMEENIDRYRGTDDKREFMLILWAAVNP